ncbi:hypothetical protein T09_14297 [Trichinella sp. T9]|nr:hypothetical protein T09_8842 [Trichinella sp. T9]KRX57130.1 hypothetical protein T09_14297 [Trichinella sp. T9]
MSVQRRIEEKNNFPPPAAVWVEATKKEREKATTLPVTLAKQLWKLSSWPCHSTFKTELICHRCC